MRWVSFSLRIFCSTYAMTLIQRALCSPDVIEAPRYFEHNFWSHKKFFKATWLERSPSHVQGFYRFSHFFRFLENSWNFHYVEGVESSGSKNFSMASKIMFKVSGGFYNIRALQRTLNQGHSMRRTKNTQWKRSPSHVQGFYRFFKISEELYFPHYTEGVESSGSKKFSMASKKMFKVSGGFYNIRALQRTLNQDHRRHRKKDTQGKLIFFFFKFFHPLAL